MHCTLSLSHTHSLSLLTLSSQYPTLSLSCSLSLTCTHKVASTFHAFADIKTLMTPTDLKDLSVENASAFLFKYAKQITVNGGQKLNAQHNKALVQKAHELIDQSYQTCLCKHMQHVYVTACLLYLFFAPSRKKKQKKRVHQAHSRSIMHLCCIYLVYCSVYQRFERFQRWKYTRGRVLKIVLLNCRLNVCADVQH